MGMEANGSRAGHAAGDGRNETREEQLDRNWNEMLQELRVMQTGTQIIAGFLLTLPFQQRFAELDAFQTALFLVLVVLAAIATGLMLVPVALHRRLFRRRIKEKLVAGGDFIVKAALVFVGLLVAGTTTFIVHVVAGPVAAAAVGTFLVLGLLAGLAVFPLLASRRPHSPP
ncbi:DUF6328 family protein [Specibacter sp. RAF43]|uniref:DUF6328 family protein n=1 Tax=Specibacter sp. RAF43 TaxID=3233057 RepID=UPI003F9E6701